MVQSAAQILSSSRIVAHPLRVIAIGDSLVYGYGDHEGGGWTERLRRCWMDPRGAGHALYNLGVRGDGVQQVLKRLEQEYGCRGELRHRTPDLIVISVGTNDSARVGRPDGRNLLAFDTFETAVAELLERAQQLAPVLFVGMVPVHEAPMPFADCLFYNHADQRRYKNATRHACETRNIPYLDLFEIWQKRGEAWWQSCLGPDGLHPNVSGYRAIYEEVLLWEPLAQLEKRALV